MGKPTGFMEYDRCEARSVEPKERIKNFDEFHIFLSKEKQREQAARCMDCGVPFCQSGMTVAGMTSGCPLHNLVTAAQNRKQGGSLVKPVFVMVQDALQILPGEETD